MFKVVVVRTAQNNSLLVLFEWSQKRCKNQIRFSCAAIWFATTYKINLICGLVDSRLTRMTCSASPAINLYIYIYCYETRFLLALAIYFLKENIMSLLFYFIFFK